MQNHLVESVVPKLNEYVSRWAELLLEGEIDIEWRTQRLLADGKTYKEEFNVGVSNRFGAGDYSGCSMGEEARVDVAIALALQDLVLNRLGQSFNFCVLDEVDKHLDEAGREHFHRVLEVLEKERQTVFVITHSDS